MPKKARENAHNPRIVHRSPKPGSIVYYIEFWPDKTNLADRRFHRAHDGVCLCGKPRPGRPCPHHLVALEVLKTFEHKMLAKPIDAPIEYVIKSWRASDQSRRTTGTIELYMTTYNTFKDWCQSQDITYMSQVDESLLTRFKNHLQTTPYRTHEHTPESNKIKRHIDYLVAKHKITRKSPEYQEALYQDKEREMRALMVASESAYTASTIHQYFRGLRVLMEYATYNKMMQVNPLDESAKPKAQRIVPSAPKVDRERNPLTDDERRRLIDQTTDDVRDMAIIYLYTGMRLGELANLHWSAHIRPDRIYISPVNGWMPKWGKNRTIPIHPLVRQVLDRQRAKHPKAQYVFNTAGKGKTRGQLVPYPERSIQDRFQVVFKNLEIVGEVGNGVSIHCFRHTFITRLLRAGEPLLRVRDIAGHKDIRTTMRYYHAIESADSQVLANLD